MHQEFGFLVLDCSFSVLYAVEFCNGNLELCLSDCSAELGFDFSLPGLGCFDLGFHGYGEKIEFCKEWSLGLIVCNCKERFWLSDHGWCLWKTFLSGAK